MDENLQAKIEEARKLGYSEEQIQAFLNQQPPAPAGAEPFQNRSEEAVGTAQYGAAEAAKYAALGGGGYYGLKKIAQALRGPTPAPGPVAPVTPAAPMVPASPPAPAIEPGGQQLKDFVQQRGQYARPTVPGQPQVGLPQTVGIGKDIATDNIIRQTALQRVLQGVAPYMRAASGIGGMLYSPSLNTGESEQLAEYRRRTGQQP